MLVLSLGRNSISANKENNDGCLAATSLRVQAYFNIYQLMNEAEYLMKNYGDQGGCYPDNTLRDLHNSSYDTKAEFNNCFIIHTK